MIWKQSSLILSDFAADKIEINLFKFWHFSLLTFFVFREFKCDHLKYFQQSFSLILYRRRSQKLQSLHNQQKSPLPIAGLPVNCCGPTPSPGSLATLSAFNTHKVNMNAAHHFNMSGRYNSISHYSPRTSTNL